MAESFSPLGRLDEPSAQHPPVTPGQAIERRLSDRIAGLLDLKAAIEERAAALRGQCVKLQDDVT